MSNTGSPHHHALQQLLVQAVSGVCTPRKCFVPRDIQTPCPPPSHFNEIALHQPQISSLECFQAHADFLCCQMDNECRYRSIVAALEVGHSIMGTAPPGLDCFLLRAHMLYGSICCLWHASPRFQPFRAPLRKRCLVPLPCAAFSYVEA